VALGAVSLLVSSPQARNQADPPALERQVHGQTITSLRSPRVEVTVDSEFTYVGGQRVTLSGNADAELHLFAKITEAGVVQSFYWIQFERFLPSNSMRYDAASTTTLGIGALSFYVDGLGYADFAAIQSGQPGSDGAAAVAILASRQLTFPRTVARVRMFHFPDSDRRSELMIICGESLPPSFAVPNGLARFGLDSDTTATVIEHMRRALTISKQP
jgi:hypothetical protein